MPERTWSGAGGRWLIWPLRAVLWAALLVIVYRGVTAIIFDEVSPSRSSGPPPGTDAAQFPVALAEAYAMAFGQVYLNFSPATQAQREQQLTAFVPPSVATSDPDLGWNGSGQMRLQSEQVAGITVQDAQHAVVALLSTVNGQLMELGVPIYARGGDVVVPAQPAWLPVPPQAVEPTARSGASSDPTAQSELMSQLPAFFQAYANGDSASLNRFLAQGTSLTGLGGTVTFDSIASLAVPPGGSTRQIAVRVIWHVAGPDEPTSAKIAATYGMSVTDLQGGKWYVKGISASTEAVGGQ